MQLAPKELQEIITIEKPWGGFVQYVLNQEVTVKILEIRAGERVSYQYHHHRSELWIPLDEGACVKLNGTLQRPEPMEPVFIPQGAKHQLIGESKIIGFSKLRSATLTKRISFVFRISMAGFSF